MIAGRGGAHDNWLVEREDHKGLPPRFTVYLGLLRPASVTCPKISSYGKAQEKWHLVERGEKLRHGRCSSEFPSGRRLDSSGPSILIDPDTDWVGDIGHFLPLGHDVV